jgi:DNA mismatch endonuclease (patch repair protein)
MIQSRARDGQTTSRIMRAVRHRNSTAEMAIRRRLWVNGIRYRLNVRLPGKPDLVFPGKRTVVFIDGDLWHGNSWRVRGLPNLEAQFPNRTDWWVKKIRRNIQRDQEVGEQLAGAGWTVLRYWESEVLADANAIARRIAFAVNHPRARMFVDVAPSAVERRRRSSIVPSVEKQ